MCLHSPTLLVRSFLFILIQLEIFPIFVFCSICNPYSKNFLSLFCYHCKREKACFLCLTTSIKLALIDRNNLLVDFKTSNDKTQ